MNPRIIIAVAVLLLGATAFFLMRSGVPGPAVGAGDSPEEVAAAVAATAAATVAAAVSATASTEGGLATLVVYKSPTCGCCSNWIDHMRKSGFAIEVHDMRDVSPMKLELGVAPRLWSCHTAKIGGYILEGHVPAAQVARMLAERPDIRGLAVPGMPIGSPGMDEGYDPSTWKDYDVVAFDAAGGTSVYAHVEASRE